jgi:hypothetical protein
LKIVRRSFLQEEVLVGAVKETLKLMPPEKKNRYILVLENLLANGIVAVSNVHIQAVR